MLLEFFCENSADFDHDQVSISESRCNVARAGEDASETLQILAPARQANEKLGDLARLGQLVPGDVVIAISNSGTTSECLLAVEAVQGYGGRVIAVTGGMDSREILMSG